MVNGGIKRSFENTGKEKLEKHEKPKKKLKSSELNVTNSSNNEAKNAVAKLDTCIFQYFTDLTQKDENERLQATIKLIQALHRSKESEKRQKELAYALKRLIRGCGATTNTSRSGFFTGLVAFLKTFKNNEIEVCDGSIFDTMQKELNVGATLANKEDANAVVGKILVCGALLRSGRISQLNTKHLERVTNILLQATRHKSYHTSISYAFVIEILETALTEQQFEDAVWPLLHKEITKSWSKQTLQTVHCLMVAQKKYPKILNTKYFKTHFGGRELLNAESYEHLKRIFWSHTDLQIITHPAFEIFGGYLVNCENLIEFWTEMVDPCVATPTKITEFLTLKIATDILQNLKDEIAGNVLVNLLSENFMKMLLNGLRHIKTKKDDTLKAFYDEYMEALVGCCAKLTDNADNQIVAIIRRLILYPGTLSIEKLTSTRVIHQLINLLGLEGVQEIYLTYKQIFCGMLQKQTGEDTTEEWQHYERSNSGYMLQHLLSHKAVQHNRNLHEWRSEQLQFLLICGIFHVQQTNNLSKNSKLGYAWFEPCKKDAACSFSKEFGEQCKNMFNSSLQSKFNNLEQEREMKSLLVKVCDKYMQKGQLKRNIRIKLDGNSEKLIADAWEKVKGMVNSTSDEDIKKSKKMKLNTKSENDKLDLVFHIMLFNMSLQLFREPDMAAPAIDDLIKCMQRIKKQQKENIKSRLERKKSNENDEPDWIEVIIDLFLHLLSQNTVALRNSVNSLFPHLCKNLSVSAIHQILSVLDMKDGQNPLSGKEEESDDVTDEEDEMSEGDTSESSDQENDEQSDDEDKDDDENDRDDGDITASNKLRNAISQALTVNGGAINGSASSYDDDMASVDLNDMTEEEGRRLDDALAAAFKTMKNSSKLNGSEHKKTKSERVGATTVMHFRIRVLDLIDIYIQQPEIYLLNHIEIMLALYNMLEFCWSDELKPLQVKIEKVISKLTDLKPASGKQSTTNVVHVEQLKAEDMVNYIRQLAEKRTQSIHFDITNSIRNRCIVFLVNHASRLANGNEQVLKVCLEFQTEFLNSRNPTVNITLLSEIYKLRWPCVWQLGLELTKKGLQMETRVFRRIQACEIIMVLYKNHELQKLDEMLARKYFTQIENILLAYIDNLTASWKKSNVRQSHKEFQTLMEVLLQGKRTHDRIKTEKALLCSSETCEKVQSLRLHIRLESTQIYQRYCGVFQLKVLRNSDVFIMSSLPPNGNEVCGECTDQIKPQLSKNKEQRNKAEHADKRKQKKQKKLERMLAASKGINGCFGKKKKVE